MFVEIRPFARIAFYLIWVAVVAYQFFFVVVMELFGEVPPNAGDIIHGVLSVVTLVLMILQLRRPSFWRWLALLIIAILYSLLFLVVSHGMSFLVTHWWLDSDELSVVLVVNLIWLIWIRDRPAETAKP